MDEEKQNKIDSLWNKDAYYQLIEHAHESEMVENKFAVQNLISLINSSDIKKIIDVGCGEGSIIKDIRENIQKNDIELWGVDVAEKGIVRAKEKEIDRAYFKVYNGVEIPFENDYFDLSFSTFVFEHLENPEQVFFEMARVTKKDGYILIACPNYGSPFFRSPCNKQDKFILMFCRLIKTFFPAYYFKESFRWSKVDPIELSANEYITDYDTLCEPNLLFFLKHIKQQRGKYEVISVSSFWQKYGYGGDSKLKKIFMLVLRFLGKNKVPFIRYYGPFFFILLKKKFNAPPYK